MKVVSHPVALVKYCPSKQRERHRINRTAGERKLGPQSSKDVQCISIMKAIMSFRKIIIALGYYVPLIINVRGY